MPQPEPTPQTTLALIFGASWFQHSSKLAAGRAFLNSAADFRDYLTASSGLAIPRNNVCWLFDDGRSPSDQLVYMARFLESRSGNLRDQQTPPRDLIVYYVGHGLFPTSDQTYYLAIKGTEEGNEGLTSIRASELASVIKIRARFLRRFLILDCCFSATTYKEFQSGPLQTARLKLLDELPQSGTALLCSSSPHDPSLAPQGLSHTMFSNALLKALRCGDPYFGAQMSLSEVGDLVKKLLHEQCPENWVRPEIHSPDQREGDIAGILMFPNAAYSNQEAEEARQKVQTERKATEEIEARERTETVSKARAAEETRQKVEAERKPRGTEAVMQTQYVRSENSLARRSLSVSDKVISIFIMLSFCVLTGWTALQDFSESDIGYGSFWALLSVFFAAGVFFLGASSRK